MKKFISITNELNGAFLDVTNPAVNIMESQTESAPITNEILEDCKNILTKLREYRTDTDDLIVSSSFDEYDFKEGYAEGEGSGIGMAADMIENLIRRHGGDLG